MQVEYRCTWEDESVVIHSEAVTWMEQIDLFRRFLLACGYHLPKGDLQFVADEDVVLNRREYGALLSECGKE